MKPIKFIIKDLRDTGFFHGIYVLICIATLIGSIYLFKNDRWSPRFWAIFAAFNAACTGAYIERGRAEWLAEEERKKNDGK